MDITSEKDKRKANGVFEVSSSMFQCGEATFTGRKTLVVFTTMYKLSHNMYT